MSQIPRDKAARLGHETVAILRQGRYLSSLGVNLDISARLDNAVTNTKEYPPDCEIEVDPELGFSPRVSVENETVMSVGLTCPPPSATPR